MRIGTAAYHKQLVSNLSGLESRIGVLANQMGTGRRVLRPSDDPRGVGMINWAHNEVGANESRLKLADNGLTILNTSDAALGEMSNLLLRAVEVAQRALRPGTTDTAMASAADDVMSSGTEIIMLANTQVGNRYIYGGYQDRAAPVTGETDTAVYNGDTQPITVPIGSGRTVDVSVTGDNLLNFVRDDGTRAISGVDADVFQSLTNLANALKAGDKDGVGTWTDNISRLREGVLEARGTVGSCAQRLEAHKSALEDTGLRLQSLLADNESVDITDAITEYSALQTDYQALISVLGRVASLPTMFDTLG
jgi:flagellar hook-associated protein 3 FlgL